MNVLNATEYRDEYIAEHYPNAVYFTDGTGEIVVCLGKNVNGEDCF